MLLQALYNVRAAPRRGMPANLLNRDAVPCPASSGEGADGGPPTVLRWSERYQALDQTADAVVVHGRSMLVDAAT
jgi:hypothetical protein